MLVADEDPHVRQILTDALSATGCTVIVASEGTEALRLAGSRKLSVVILSLTLRGSNGITTLASLRANPALRDIPVVMLVPRELSSEEMDQLQEAVTELADSGELPTTPVVQTIRTALSTDGLPALQSLES